MEFEWDENKRQEVWDRRQVDLAHAVLVFDDASRKTLVDAKHGDGEIRYLTLGRVGEQSFVVAYTRRAEKIRIVTAWRVGEVGRRRFQALFDRADPGNE